MRLHRQGHCCCLCLSRVFLRVALSITLTLNPTWCVDNDKCHPVKCCCITIGISVTSNHIRNKQRRVIIVQQSFYEYTSGVKSWISEGFDFVWLNRKFKWTPIWHSVYCFLNRNKWAWLNYGTTLLGNDNEYYKYLMKVNYQLGAKCITSPAMTTWPHSHCNSQWSCWCSITSPAYQEGSTLLCCKCKGVSFDLYFSVFMEFWEVISITSAPRTE